MRPGLQPERWETRNNMTAWGMVETANYLPTAPKELSIFVSEGYYGNENVRLRRFALRVDGFVSVRAPLKGGELVTRPFTFEGGALSLNISTSAAGSARVELQDADSRPIEGYALSDCDEIYGDDLERMVMWKGRADVRALAGQTVRLRFALSDADLYSLQFTPLPN